MDYIYPECNLCGICKVTDKQCAPKGTDTPVLYFVGEAPGPDERKEGIPFVGRAGKYLHNILDKYGLNENNCRFFNIVRCYPSDDAVKFRAPNDTEINNCYHFVEEDIERTHPKVVVALGATAAKKILGEDIGITKLRGHEKVVKFGNTDITVMPTYHPSYLMRNPNDVTIGDFESDIKVAMALSIGEIESSASVASAYRKNTSNTVLCRTYKEFNSFCNKFIDNEGLISYDVETNALEVHSVGFKVVGFSLASSRNEGCYVCIESLDYNMPETDLRLISKRLRAILLSHPIMVYNCMYELPATLNWLDIEIPDIEDLFVKVKLMMGSADQYAGNGGLKMQSMMHLKYEDWSEDLDTYFDLVKIYEKDGVSDKVRKLLSKYYDDNDSLDNICKIVENVALNDIKSKGTNSYGLVPSLLIGRYGSIDASVLFELKEFYDNWMVEEGNNLSIDLFKGYKYWMEHHYAGYILERNGVYWNEEVASRIDKWCRDGMLETIKNMIFSDLSKPYLKDALYEQFLSYLKDNYIDKILGQGVIIKRAYKSSLKIEVSPTNLDMLSKLAKMSIFPDEKYQCKVELGNIETLAREFLAEHSDLYDNWYDKYMDSLKNSDHSYEEYKKIMSPTSTSDAYKKFVSDILITDDIRYAKLYNSIVVLLESPDFDFDELSYVVRKRYSDETTKYVISAESNDGKLLKIVEKLRHDENMTPSLKVDMFMKFISRMDGTFTNWIVKSKVTEALSFSLKSMDAGVMNEVYELYLMRHIDVDDSKTWNDRFEWLFNYKLFKKYYKVLSTYIQGKTGRRNVYIVDKNSLQNGDKLTRREVLYSEIPEDTDMSSKEYIMQADFKVNMADTGRWQAGIHNTPVGDVKEIFTSRFPGGCIMMPDGSQMEVRTMAAEAGDENLMQAFRDGLDIHRFFASKIYGVPYDDVEKWQRGLAKNAVFGLLYGESEQAFADSYMHGDIEAARKVFDDMFKGFPKIKGFIDRAHNQYKEFGKVTTITQRYINLNATAAGHHGIEDQNAMLRRAQNSPIQGAAEDIAGVIMYNLIKYLEDNNMKSKPFCFIHDSIEIDTAPDEVFRLIDIVNYLFNVFPMKEFGVPVACDVPLGPSMGQEIEVEHMDHDEEYNNIVITLNGYADDIDDLIKIWESAYALVKLDDSYDGGEPKQEFLSYKEMFLPKKAKVSRRMGTYRDKVSRRYIIKVSE